MPVYETANAVKIAVLQEQIAGLREQQKINNDVTQRRLAGLENKLDDLATVMNRGRGAYAASMALAAGVGGFLIAILNLATSYFHK